MVFDIWSMTIFLQNFISSHKTRGKYLFSDIDFAIAILSNIKIKHIINNPKASLRQPSRTTLPI